MFDSTRVFNDEFDIAIAAEVANSGFAIEDWFRNGQQLPANAIEDWRKRGPELVERYIKWFESSGYEIWVTPDGQEAIELELNVMFGKVPVHAFIDQVLVGPYGLIVNDLKSGSKKPDGWGQIGLYASCVELAYGIRPLYGSYYMARGFGPRGTEPDKLTYQMGPMPLTAYELSIPYFTEQLEAMQRGVEAEAFVARVSKDCDRCSVAWACRAVGGYGAERHDPTHPEYVPFLAA